MYLAQVTFGTDGGKYCQRDELQDIGEEYLSKLWRSGQTYPQFLTTWSKGKLISYTRLARPNAYHRRHLSKWGKDALKTVVKTFGQEPQWKMIDDDVPKRFRSWRRSSSFFLFTNPLGSPQLLSCGDTGLHVPVYLLSIPHIKREDLYHWARAYLCMYHIWLDTFPSSTLEIPAYKETADPGSELSSTGRLLGAEIEKATGTPTYYYLLRHWGRKVGEEKRLCPGCGKPWHVLTEPQEDREFHQFDFRCEPCRLVSHVGVSCFADEQRYARIGEFKKPKAK
jgi:predicted  nucleic acid-binding Zn ribbon protein